MECITKYSHISNIPSPPSAMHLGQFLNTFVTTQANFISFLLAILERRHHFLGNLGEEAPFYWVNWGGGLEVFFYVLKLCWRLVVVSFYSPCSTWRVYHFNQAVLLVWPYTMAITLCQLLNNHSHHHLKYIRFSERISH